MRSRLLITTLLLTSILVWIATAATLRASWRVVGALADATPLAEIGVRPQTTVVFDRYGHQAFSFFVEQRIDVPVDRVSPRMIDAVLSVEDRRFYAHHGLDPLRIAKAAWRNWRSGRIVEGGSTITQQLGRIEQLTHVRTFDRKIREAAIAVRLEERYTKPQILQAYLNVVYFGDGYHGVEAAARGYFRKAASDLQPHEAALLAALIRSPRSYSPTTAPRRALARRNLVLRLMRDTGRLSDAEYTAAVAMPVTPPAQAGTEIAAAACGRYFQEEVRRELVARFGGKRVLQGGLRVFTGYDRTMQCAAERAIDSRIQQIVKAHRTARDLEGSLVALDPASGEVRALVGGRDFGWTSYIRATQSRRQPGSAFKPIIYAAALEHGMTPASILHNLDAPIMTAQGPWLPGGEHEQTEYSLRTALRISSNRAAAQLLQQVGLRQATYYAERLGITSRLPSVPSLALGTGGVTLLELTSAYGVFANQGLSVSPHLIVRVEDRAGQSIWDDLPAQHQAVTPATAFLMSSMLQDVITSGTGTGARAAGFNLPAAGKTGTTDNYTDAWFIGYTPHLVTGVWFGLDKPAPIMNRGFAAVVAVPAWADFMKQATAMDPPDWFSPPPDVEKITICRVSGLRATDACRRGSLASGYLQAGLIELPGLPVGGDPIVGTSGRKPVTAAAARSGVYDEYYPIGTAPADFCPVHGELGLPDARAEARPVGTSGVAQGQLQQVSIGPDGRVTWIIKR
ncbi:MAG TPA: PBP1A family penicillin-binding protein [Vicinamibacterales bacterium]|nr:PBP1A family penicillin-binding protein [Vicinamibacterales bacterium]